MPGTTVAHFNVPVLSVYTSDVLHGFRSTPFGHSNPTSHGSHNGDEFEPPDVAFEYFPATQSTQVAEPAFVSLFAHSAGVLLVPAHECPLGQEEHGDVPVSLLYCPIFFSHHSRRKKNSMAAWCEILLLGTG